MDPTTAVPWAGGTTIDAAGVAEVVRLDVDLDRGALRGDVRVVVGHREHRDHDRPRVAQARLLVVAALDRERVDARERPGRGVAEGAVGRDRGRAAGRGGRDGEGHDLARIGSLTATDPPTGVVAVVVTAASPTVGAPFSRRPSRSRWRTPSA